MPVESVTTPIIIEATAVTPDGRITSRDLGLWEDEQIEGLKNLVKQIHSHETKVGIQISHAGRKAENAINLVAPSDIPYSEKGRTPRELTTTEVKEMVQHFQQACERAVKADVDFIELHFAHGYLLHQFHSKLTNHRSDEYGNLSAFGVEVIQAVKQIMPEEMPLVIRVSAREYHPEGYSLDEILPIFEEYKQAGADIFHVSSGGDSEFSPEEIYAGYQVPFAKKIKETLNVSVIAVGILGNPELAEAVIKSGSADFVAIGRTILNNPYWALHAKWQLDDTIDVPFPLQRGFTRHFLTRN